MTHTHRSKAAPSRAVALAVALAGGLWVAAGSGSSADAAVLTSSPTAPTGAAIAQPDFSAAAFNGGQDFTDNAGPPGQTFTVGATPLLLSAVTVKGFANTAASFGGNVNTGTWTVTLSIVGAGGVLTQLDQETADPAAVTDGSAYLTLAFNQGTPVTLAANTQYAFDVFSSTGYYGLAKSTADVYAGGAAIQHGSVTRTSATGATIVNPQAVDRTFFVSGTPVPEPAGAGLLVVAAGGMLARRRRRRPGC